MINLERILEPATPELFDPQHVVAVVRYKEIVRWLLLEPENLILDWRKQRDEFVAAGYQVPDLNVVAAQRAGIVVLDKDRADEFLHAPEVHKLSVDFLRKALLERFKSAQSWWDVGFLFPIAFVDFDSRRLAAFYHNGPRLERYVPAGWVGEFTDFANSYPEEVFPAADKFWIVDGRDLLHELNERGYSVEARRAEVDD